MPPHKPGYSKAQNFKGSAKRLIGILKPYRFRIIIVAIFVVISVACAIGTTLILNHVLQTLGSDLTNIMANLQSGALTNYNYPLGEGINLDFFIAFNMANQHIYVNWPFFFIWFGMALVGFVLSAVATFVESWLIVKISTDLGYKLREEVKEKLDKLPLTYFDQNLVGDILSRGTNDVRQVQQSLQTIINQTLGAILQFVFITIIMFFISWQLTLVAFATLPLLLLASILIIKFSQKKFVQAKKGLGLLSGLAEETYSGYRVVKLFNMEKRVKNDFDKINLPLAKDERMSQWLTGFIFPSMHFISNLGFVGVCLVGGLISRDDPTNLASMAIFILLLNMFQQPFQQLGQISGEVQSTVASAERLFVLFDSTEEVADPINAIENTDNVAGDYVFKDVAFSYDKEKELIRNLNLSVKRGDSVAIVGPTGAGKTTLVNLLMRFYEIDEGSISLDGHDIRDYGRNALREPIGMVLQDTWLFAGSVRDNVKYGNQHATDEEIEKACVAARADHFIKTLPGGLDFKLSEDGSNISQGQRQLLTIARALVSNPRIIILDEATSSVDTRTEVAVQEAMNEMMKGKTSFIIAHRLSTIKNARVILVMNKGNIIEKGNHKELLAANGFYAELYNAQFSGQNPLAPLEVEAEHNT